MKIEITAIPASLRLSVPIPGSGFPRKDQRHIVLPAETIARYLGKHLDQLTPAKLQEFGRIHETRIIRRALELEAAKKIIPHLPIDAPRGRGLSDILFVWPGQL